MNKKSICFSFICQAGELELKALLLVASVRHHNQQLNLKLVAAIPDESLWGEVTVGTKSLLQKLGVELQYVESPFRKEYPIGNKFSALGVETTADVTVFLDSDILCLRSIDEQALMTKGLLAKPADVNTFSYGVEQWQQAYKLLNLGLPEEKVLSTVSDEVMMPYFNAGVIAVANGPEFSKWWLAVAKQIDAEENIDNKRPWLDQISLPITAKSHGYALEVLTERYNYPAHLRCINEQQLPVLCHYHWPAVVEQEASLSALVAELSSQYRRIEELINFHPEWNSVLKRAELEKKKQYNLFGRKRRNAANEESNNFLITGLPRSGTSLLCSLLNSANNIVVINEPREIFSVLEGEAGLDFELYYREQRTKITLGRPIINKVNEQGEVIEDTRMEDVRREYTPQIKDAGFLLGSKNPLAYLTRLRHLCDVMPQMTKIAMIRHPFDTISSWKKSFEHLSSVDLQQFPFAYNDELLDAFQRKSLKQINNEASLVVKRALLWRYLAELIWRDRDNVVVVKYEQLLKEPNKVLVDVFTALGRDKRHGIETSHIRSELKESELDKHERNVTALICGDMMEKWGYER